MRKSMFFKMWAILILSILGVVNANAQFLEETETVDIVQIPGFNGDGSIAQYYLADLGTSTDSIAWTTETGDIAKWYKIPAGGVSDGAVDVQAYYYKNVATGKYLYVSDAVQTELAGERGGDWPTARAGAAATNDKTAAFKWFDRTSPWPWGSYITNAAGIDMTQADGNRYNSLTGIILMKISESGINGQEFFGVYEPNASVGGFKGGLGNAWTAVKTPVVLKEDVLNPDVPHFIKNAKNVDIVKIPGFNADGNMTQYYLADLGTLTDSIAWTTDAGDIARWYKIPAGSVSDSTADVQAYYYKNIVTGRYLYVSDAVQAELAGERGGDWPTARAGASSTKASTANFKWFDRPSPWPWGVYITNAAGIDPTQADGNRYNSLTGIILMKINEGGINGQEFFGVYEPNVSIGGFKGGLGNAWTALKTPVVAQTNVANPDYLLENTVKVDVVQIPGFNSDGGMEQYYLADLGASTDSIAWSAGNSDVTKWYKIPAGPVSDGTTDVQAYYYKNFVTGRYLHVSDATQAVLAGGRGGDWPTARAEASAANDKTASFKWFDRTSPWPWGVYITNAAGIDLTQADGNRYNSLTGIILMKINEGGINGQEFFGVYEPNASVGGFKGGLGNAWTALKTPVVVQPGVVNPDFVSDGSFTYSIQALNFFATDDGEDANASSYNAETHAITYKNGGWHRAGWNWEIEGGIDASEYNQVWIKFDASALPKTGDGEGGATKLQFDVVYMDDTNAATENNKSNEIRSNATEYFYNLTPGKKIKRITLKSEAEGDIVLTDAYLFNKGIDPVDLVITDINWTPVSPVLGDSVLFNVTIKNQSEFVSQNVKHGVTFSVKLPTATGNGTLVAWSDTHLTAIPAGESVTLTANAGPNVITHAAKWRPGAARTFTVVAQVNDQKDVLESDYNNNRFEKQIVILAANGLDEIASNGKVLVVDGKIYFVNFPLSTMVSIYNLQGQELGHYRASEVSKLNLSKSLYVLKVQDGEKSTSLKVLIK